MFHPKYLLHILQNFRKPSVRNGSVFSLLFFMVFPARNNTIASCSFLYNFLTGVWLAIFFPEGTHGCCVRFLWSYRCPNCILTPNNKVFPERADEPTPTMQANGFNLELNCLSFLQLQISTCSPWKHFSWWLSLILKGLMNSVPFVETHHIRLSKKTSDSETFLSKVVSPFYLAQQTVPTTTTFSPTLVEDVERPCIPWMCCMTLISFLACVTISRSHPP